jgi:hypothetical protein
MTMTKGKTKIAMLAAGIGTATVAGFGLAMGKDIYKSTKRNVLAVVVLASMVVGPFIGGRGLVRGHDRGWAATIILTILGNLLLISVGFISALAFMYFVVMFFDLASERSLPLIIAGAGIITLLFTLVGIAVGMFQRARRLMAINISYENAQYLSNIGFIETDGSDITHYDPDGEPLRFIEAHSDRLVFMTIGKRGKRSFIQLDDDGRMVNYSRS